MSFADTPMDQAFRDKDAVRRLQRAIQRRIGVNLRGKEGLLRQRLRPLFANGEVQNVEQLIRQVEESDAPQLVSRIIDRVTTHHTYFYREPPHFEWLQRFLSTEHRPGKRLRIWSAACSTGEESYTIAMVAAAVLGAARFAREVSILGTDVSAASVARAEAGVYSKEAVSKLPAALRSQTRDLGGDRVEVHPEVRACCLFRTLNLLRPEYPFKESMDIVFCRNVFIYFDRATRQGIVARFGRHTRVGGYLVTSQTETLNELVTNFDPLGSGVHQRCAA